MSTNYPHDIEKMAGNVTISGDYIFAHYILTGYNVTSASPESLERAQDAHDSLLKVLAGFALPLASLDLRHEQTPMNLLLACPFQDLQTITFPTTEGRQELLPLNSTTEILRSSNASTGSRYNSHEMYLP